MRFLVLPVDIVAVIGGHERDARVLTHAQKSLVYGFLQGDSVILKLQEEVSLPENALVPESRLFSLLVHAAGQISLHLTCQTRRKADKSLLYLSRVSKSTLACSRIPPQSPWTQFSSGFHNLCCSLPAAPVVITVLTAYRLPVKAGARSHIDLASQYGLMPASLAAL